MKRVLVVDDSPVMRHYVARALKMTGMNLAIHEAENGRVAMEKAFQILPDVIITDLNMPEMSGQELVARVHAAAELSATRVLVLSADRSDGRVGEMTRAGADDYLTKPVTPEALKNSLMRILEVRP
jgi:two-component system chemotaxis response regulator CheY